MCEVNLDVGDTIFFQGSLLEHGVTPSYDENVERYMIGFEWKPFEQGTGTEQESLCNKFRHASLLPILLQCVVPYFNACALFAACHWLFNGF